MALVSKDDLPEAESEKNVTLKSAGGHAFSSQSPGRILDDINGHIFIDIEEFHTKFFTGKSWTSTAKDFISQDPRYNQTHNGANLASLEGLHSWLACMGSSLEEHTKVQCTKYGWHVKNIESIDGHEEILVLAKHRDKNDIAWDDVKVLGKFQHRNSYLEGLVQLCGHARSIFATQTARVFLHALYISEHHTQLCLFDRSGLYMSPQFDTAQEFKSFTLSLVGYMLMGDDELGSPLLVKEDTNGVFVDTLPTCEFADGHGTDQHTKTRRFYLGDKLYGRGEKDLVCHGVSVYRARLSTRGSCEYAVKFKWYEAVDDDEFQMLELVKEKNVPGVVRLQHHLVGTSLSALHHGLTLGKPRKLQLVVGGSSEDGEASKACLVDADDSKGSRDHAKVLHCIIVMPLGRSIENFNTVNEVLHGLADALWAHQMLYLNGKILHQDISPGNILIPDQTGGTFEGRFEGLRGVLIDLDCAESTSAPYIPFQATGTGIFKAIGVHQAYLPDNPHTYRHDLESFLYVFLYLAICSRPSPLEGHHLRMPESSILREWKVGRPFDKANRKMEDMRPENFHKLVAEFTPEFKELSGLAEDLREILLPLRDDELWTRTDMSPEGTNALYSRMIKAFRDAAQDYGEISGPAGNESRM